MISKALLAVLLWGIGLPLLSQNRNLDGSSNASQTGRLEIRIDAKGPAWGEEKDWSAGLFNSSWGVVKGGSWATGTSVESSTMEWDVPAGTYYVTANASISSYYGPSAFSHAWLTEYYNNSPNRGGATLVTVNASDTTRIVLDLDWTSFVTIATNPPGLKFIVDGNPLTSPRTFEWRKSDTHTIGANEYEDLPNENDIRCYFREWRHGGERIQSYTVPAPKFMQGADTLIARFDYKYRLDVVTPYGHPKPKASDWYPAWKMTTFSVEDTVIEYSDGTFAFFKNLVKKDSIRHLFDCWTGTGYGAYNGKDNPAAFLLNANTVETANWKDQFPLIVLIPDTSLGTVSVNPKGVWQDKDSTVMLTAMPRKGSGFIGWEGAVNDTAKTVRVKMDTSKIVTARFKSSTDVSQKQETDHAAPESVQLYQNRPNPFNASTEIRFNVPFREKVRIEIYSLIGERLTVLADAEYGAGSYTVFWDGTAARGGTVGSGIYLCRMKAGNVVRMCKLNLIK